MLHDCYISWRSYRSNMFQGSNLRNDQRAVDRCKVTLMTYKQVNAVYRTSETLSVSSSLSSVNFPKNSGNSCRPRKHGLVIRRGFSCTLGLSKGTTTRFQSSAAARVPEQACSKCDRPVHGGRARSIGAPVSPLPMCFAFAAVIFMRGCHLLCLFPERRHTIVPGLPRCGVPGGQRLRCCCRCCRRVSVRAGS